MVASPSTVSINRSGRYMCGQLQTTNHLSLAEVQVLNPDVNGTPTATPTPTVTTYPTEPTPEPLQHAWYLYDGDGNMVKGIVNNTTTYYPGRHYNLEVNGTTEKAQKFYFAGGATIAVRTMVGEEDTLQWILSDHLNSASVTANEDGTWNSSIQYTAFGEIRASSGLTATKYRYTGQLAQDVLGLDYYVARFYDPLLSHFVSADTKVQNPTISALYDRYSYVMNNPLRFIDPSGNSPIGECGPGDDCDRKPRKPYRQVDPTIKKIPTTPNQVQTVKEKKIWGLGYETTINHPIIRIKDFWYGEISIGITSTNSISENATIIFYPKMVNERLIGGIFDTENWFAGYDEESGIMMGVRSPETHIGVLTPPGGTSHFSAAFSSNYSIGSDNGEVSLAVFPIDVIIESGKDVTENMTGIYFQQKCSNIDLRRRDLVTLLTIPAIYFGVKQLPIINVPINNWASH